MSVATKGPGTRTDDRTLADAETVPRVSQAILEAAFATPGTPAIARRPLRVDPRPAESTAMLAALMAVMLLIGVAALVLAAQAARPPAAPDQRPVEGRAGVRDAPAAGAVEPPAQVPTVVPSAEPATTAVVPGPAEPTLVVGGRARVANTAGRGVILHTEPRRGARMPAGLLEGAPVTLLELAGEEWARVRSAQGQVGWVPTEYLAPTS